MVKAAKQRRSIAVLQQAMLVQIWLHRQELRALDQHDQQQLDEEAAAIAELEAQFEQYQPAAEEPPEPVQVQEGAVEVGRM